MKISVIVPCRNERKHIDTFLHSVFAQIPASSEHTLEVVIADGVSDDGTRERLGEWQERHPTLLVIDNPDRITSAGLNKAIGRASGDIIVRMDVHTVYAPDYVLECARALAQTGATCVGGPWRPVGEGRLQKAIARAFESRFGSGGAASRRTDYTGPVDTVYLGAWRRADLVRVGGFDESLVRNQDDELNLRIIRGGGTVWQSADIRSSYAPRASLRALFRQFYQYGYWKIPVIRKHRLPAAPRHLVPFAFVLALGGLAIAAPFWPTAGAIGLALLVVYFVSATVVAAGLSRPLVDPQETLGIASAFACMHFGYGIGFGHGLLDFVVLRKGPHGAMTRLTR